MKKAVVTILLVLPFIMIIMISFAARIVSNYQFIGVESVCLQKDERKCYTDIDSLKVSLGGEINLKVKIYPELATNQNVSYITSDESVVTVSELGVIKGVSYGTAKVWVISQDKRDITTSINIVVSDDFVSSVEINVKELNLDKKQNYQLSATIAPYTALNKAVIWESSDTSVVTIDSNGLLKAIGSGIATITVTTIDGNKTDTCTVTVNEEVNFGFVDYEEGKGMYFIDTSIIDLESLLLYNSELIDLENVVYEVSYGEYESLEGSVLTLKPNKPVRITAKVRNSDYVTEIVLKYNEN